MKIVRILWRDHFTLSGWQDENDISALTEGELCESVGYLVKETKKVMVLAQTIGDDVVSEITLILGSCVESVEVLTETED